MQLSLSLAPPRLFHPDRPTAIVAWRDEAGNVPLRLLRNGRVGPGNRVRTVLLGSAVAVFALALAGFAVAVLLPLRASSTVALQMADTPVPAAVSGGEVSESRISDSAVALALQAAGALSGPLPGHEKPALRFGALPDLPAPELPSIAATPAHDPSEIAPAIAVGPHVEPAPVEAPALPPVAAEPAAGSTAEPVVTAALPRRAAIGAAVPHPAAARVLRKAAAPAVKPRPVVLASRSAKAPAARSSADTRVGWTLPGALAPTGP